MMPSISGFALDLAIYFAVTITVVYAAARVLLPSTHRLTAWHAVLVQVMTMILTLPLVFLVGWLLYTHITVALVVMLAINLLAQKSALAGLYIAWHDPIPSGRAYAIAFVTCLSSWFVAAPLSAWLQNDTLSMTP